MFSIPELTFGILSELQYTDRDLIAPSVVCRSWREVTWPLRWTYRTLESLLLLVGPLEEGKNDDGLREVKVRLNLIRKMDETT